MHRKNVVVAAGLAALVLSTMGTGIYLKHYFVVFAFAVWLCVEALLWRFPGFRRALPRQRLPSGGRLAHLSDLLGLYRRSDAASETLLQEKMSELKIEGSLSESESRWLERLKELVELRALVFGKPLSGRRGLRQAFAYASNVREQAKPTEEMQEALLNESFTVQDVTESAIVMADLYWKLYETCLSGFSDLRPIARRLFADIFGIGFDNEIAAVWVEGVLDSMQRDSGVPFLVFNLIRKDNLVWARHWAQLVLTKDLEVDEEIRSVLYWVTELHWFTREKKTLIGDYEETIRYLYHLCFTEPERAGFLEIDSHFFSQFETVNELAREGFLFKETLLEKVLWLWREHEGYFDEIFRTVLEAMTQQKSKIYDERDSWERFWKRESDNFCRDYLYVVEGNLCYARGHFQDACTYYEKAMKLNPKLRSALLNVVFCYARLEKPEMHELMVAKLLSDDSLLPSALYVIGNSYLLLGDSARADAYYDELKRHPGWHRKTQYYKSTFCYENGLFEKALEFARLAHEESPEDSSIRYHLSVCYNAVGEKDRALDMVKKVEEAPLWLNYYRFTLERDSGRTAEAAETLMQIPSEYFDDPEEFEAALDFARDRKDLVLLRHLRNRH